MSLYIGIDLGTTYSAAAMLDKMGKPEIVRDSNGVNVIPSIVNITDQQTIHTGSKAKGELGLSNTVAHRFKRMMGTGWKFTAHGSDYSATQLSAFVLKKIKDEVEAGNGNITEAVVTVPANFANEAREATMQAAKDAGINVQYIINEPTAAALYYGSQTSESMTGTYVVYDLGGGTFDVSVIKVQGEDIDVIATDGVSALGGRDFDDALTDLVKRKYKEETGGELLSEDFTPNNAEDLKKDLSEKELCKTRVAGESGRINVKVARSEFEESISKWIAQTEMLCEAVLDEAGLEPSDIKKVILVGGSSRIPVISRSIKRVFKQEPNRFGNPDEVVALGASLYAAYKSDKSGLNEIQRVALEQIKITDITSKYFGTSCVIINEAKNKEELQNSIILQKGESLPVSKTSTYYTRVENQLVVNLDVTESNAPETDLNFVKVIWKGELELPPNRPSEQPIEITYSYDENQIMHASFKDVESGAKHEIDISISGTGDSSANIDMFVVE